MGRGRDEKKYWIRKKDAEKDKDEQHEEKKVQDTDKESIEVVKESGGDV